MARKNGLPRSTPALGQFGMQMDEVKSDKRDATMLLATDKVRVVVAHRYGKRVTVVHAHDIGLGSIILNSDETSELAQALLDAQEEIRR